RHAVAGARPGRAGRHHPRRQQCAGGAARPGPPCRRRRPAGAGVPFRKSVLEDPKVREGVTMPASWLDAVVGSGNVSRLSLPVIIPVTEFRDIYGVALTNLIAGADPAEELKKATDQFQPVLDRSEQG
ncbi:hypothetical protein AB0V92_14535, partial [Mesorhizobium ciceri]